MPKVQRKPHEKCETEIPRSSPVTSANGISPEEQLDYQMLELVASNLAQAAIVSSEKPLTPKEIARLHTEILLELFRQNDAERVAK